MKFLITGGVARFLGELKSHGKALKNGEIAVIDFDNKTYSKRLSYITPPEFCPDDEPSIGFTSASIYQNSLYVATSTQVLIISLPDFRILQTINHASFHDIHHVAVIDNFLYVVVTGLDAVFKFFLSGEFIEGVNVAGKDLWHRFKQTDDMRKIQSAKPHNCHPNFVFSINKEIWLTRFEQRDAIDLKTLSQKIDIQVERPHDGLLVDNKIYFTTVNGHIVVADATEKKIIRDIDLNKLDPRKDSPLGWCRGIYVAGDFAYVGFTQLRSTAFTENLKWLKNMIDARRYVKKPLPTRISKYNLKTEEFIDELQFPMGEITALFSILKYDF